MSRSHAQPEVGGWSQRALPFAAGVILTTVSGLTQAQVMPAKTPPQPASSGYVLDNGRTVVTSGYNLCWRAGFWTPAHAIIECDPDLVPKPAVVAQVTPPPAVVPPQKPQPTPQPQPQPVPVAPTVERITLAADALFDFDKAALKAEGRSKLDELAAKLRAVDLEVVVAEGHTDSIGSDAYNQKLSERRAAAVKTYLVERGIPAERIRTVGKGEKEPVAENRINGRDNPKGRAQNRRVEVEVTGTQMR